MPKLKTHRGAAKRFNALKWTIVERMVWAWLLTIPVSAAIAWLLYRVLEFCGLVEPATS